MRGEALQADTCVYRSLPACRRHGNKQAPCIWTQKPHFSVPPSLQSLQASLSTEPWGAVSLLPGSLSCGYSLMPSVSLANSLFLPRPVEVTKPSMLFCFWLYCS